MSDAEGDAPLPLAVTTCCLEIAERGLVRGLCALLSLQPAGLVLDGLPGPLRPEDRRALREAGVPVVAATGCGAAPEGATLDAPEDALAAQALAALRHASAGLAKLRCPCLLIPVGGGGLPGLAATRALLDTAEDPAALAASYRREQGAAREEAAERLARRLHALARAEPGLGLLLLPGPEPLSLLDLEVAGWLLDDLSGVSLALALDTGRVAAGVRLGGHPPAAWLDREGHRTRLLLFGDHAAGGQPDLLLGTGVLRLGDLRGLLPRAVPWALRGTPEAPAALLREAARLLHEILGGGSRAPGRGT